MNLPSSLSRRKFLSLAGVSAAATLAGCASSPSGGQTIIYSGSMPSIGGALFGGSSYHGDQPDPAVIYAAVEDNGYMLPAIPYQQIDPKYWRQRVVNDTGQPAGSVVVDTRTRFLYITEQGGTAMRYGIGVGREGFAWQGEGVIQWRQKWPRWTPPAEMVARQPDIRPLSAERGGMNPGPTNPLGARALYIFNNGKDTLYRVHGTPDWQSIGKATSSGCVRMLNQDVIDLYNRVPAHTQIVVM